MTDKFCEHKTSSGVQCGKLAVALIKLKEGRVTQLDTEGWEIGRGVGSQWIPVCQEHVSAYPDHDGFDL